MEKGRKETHFVVVVRASPKTVCPDRECVWRPMGRPLLHSWTSTALRVDTHPFVVRPGQGPPTIVLRIVAFFGVGVGGPL